MNLRWMLLPALLAGACVSRGDDSGPPNLGDDDTVQPDAAPAGPVCAEDECGLPGDEPCCSGTSCYDFGHWGGQQCETTCASDADCSGSAGYVCDEGVCSPAPFGDPGGIYPEALCYTLSSCGYGAESTCLQQTQQCVDGLTSDQLHTWIDEMYACYTNEADTCGDFDSCWVNTVSWC